MEVPKDISERLHDGAGYWIDSINGWGFFDKDEASFSGINNNPIELTCDDISTLGSCLGL